MKTTLAARPAGSSLRGAGRDASPFFLPGLMLEAAATCCPSLPRVLERLLRMQNAEIALQLLYAHQPLPELATLQALRRYLAGEALPTDQAARCQQLLAQARPHQE